MSDEKQLLEIKRVKTVAMCAPACRMALVVAYADGLGVDDNTDHDILPVVAIRTTVFRSYFKVDRSDNRWPREGGSDSALLRFGWELDSEYETIEPVVLDTDGTLTTITERGDSGLRLAVTPWPTEEDEARLAGTVTALLAFVRRKLARNIARSKESAS